MNKMLSLLLLLTFTIYMINGELTSEPQCISIKFEVQGGTIYEYLVYDGDNNVFTSAECSAKWTIMDIVTTTAGGEDPDELCVSGAQCIIIHTGSNGLDGRYLSDIADAGELQVRNPLHDFTRYPRKGAWFILRRNLRDGAYQIFNMNLHSQNKNPLLCFRFTTQGGELYWEEPNAHFCGWDITPNEFPQIAQIDITANDVIDEIIETFDTAINSNYDFCLHTETPTHEEVNLVHNGSPDFEVSLSTICSSKWFINYHINDDLCIPGAQCVTIKVADINIDFYLSDIAEMGKLQESEGTGAYFQISDLQTQLVNVHLNSIGENPSLCSQLRFSGPHLYFADSDEIDCIWSIHYD